MELLSRRTFVRNEAIAVTSLAIFGCKSNPDTHPTAGPATTIVNQTTSTTNGGYTDDWCKQLGQELRNWSLIRGTRVVDFNKEAQSAASLLLGETNPSTYIPKITTPLRLYIDNSSSGSVVFDWTFKENGPRKIKVELPNGKIHELPWIERMEAKFTLSDETFRSSARPAVIAKEASQIVDYINYCQLYLAVTQEMGVKTTLLNPEGNSTSPLELVIAYSRSIAGLEKPNLSQSFFAGLIGYGAFLRVGGVLFANWLQDNENRGINTPNSQLVKDGSKSGGFLQSKGLIAHQQRGADRIIHWISGQAPQIQNREVLGLYREYMKKTNPVF